jgi:hypothetical protein
LGLGSTQTDRLITLPSPQRAEYLQPKGVGSSGTSPGPCRRGVRDAAYGGINQFGIHAKHPEQSGGRSRAGQAGAALLQVPQRSHAHLSQVRKLPLRQPDCTAPTADENPEALPCASIESLEYSAATIITHVTPMLPCMCQELTISV